MKRSFVDTLHTNENNPNRILPFKIHERTDKYHSKKQRRIKIFLGPRHKKKLRPKKEVRSGQVWEHAPEQRVTASTFHWHSRGLRLAIAQADAWPISITLRCSSTCCNHKARGRPIGFLHSRDSLTERIWRAGSIHPSNGTIHCAELWCC